MLRAVIYCRVSTEEQATEGQSIAAQRNALLDYAAKNHMLAVDEFIDEGVSARTADRPQFQRMVSSAKQKPKPFDVILIHKTDRFARNREDAIVYKSLLRRDCGIEIKSITEQFEDSPTGKLLEGMMEVMAEFYSLNLSQEVMKGMKEKATHGLALGMPPLGYRVSESGQYEIVPEEAAIVQFIFSTYTKEQKGLLTVARRLHEDGVRLFGPAGAKYKWSSVGIRVIITNPAYTGKLIWNRRDGSKKHRIRKPEDWIVVDEAHEPIVDQGTFDLAQQILKGRRGVRNPIQDYLLRGMARCADCGASMCYYPMQWNTKGGKKIIVPKLSCTAYHQSRRCYFNHVKISDVETAIFAHLQGVMEGRVAPDDLNITFPHLESLRRDAEELRHQLGTVDGKLQRQLQAYEAGVIDLDDLKAAKERVAKEKEGLHKQLSEMESRMSTNSPKHLEQLRGRTAAVLETATDESLTPALRRQALHSVVDHVEYSRRADLLNIVLKVDP